MKRKRDRAIEHILRKENLEDVLKCQAWVIVSALIFRTSIGAMQHHAYVFGIICFFVFIALSALILFYSAMYIAMPLEKALNGPFPASQPHPTGLREILTSPISSLLTIPGVLYVAMSLGFFMFTNEFVKAQLLLLR